MAWGDKVIVLSTLSNQLGSNPKHIEQSCKNYLTNPSPNHEFTLRNHLIPQYEKVFYSLISQPDGFLNLINFRADVIKASQESKGDGNLQLLNKNLKRILQEYFNVSNLNLERITWDKPASLLEKVIKYSEEVHPMNNWSNLKNRVGNGKRCYGFFHPSIPNDPVAFIEVALTKELSKYVAPLISKESDVIEREADTAIFYAIISTKDGLSGIDLGHSLITNVVSQLQAEFHGLKLFSTLSPVPGFKRWLDTSLNQYLSKSKFQESPILNEDEIKELESFSKKEAHAALKDLLTTDWFNSQQLSTLLQKPLTRLITHYLTQVKKHGFAYCSVANFHLRNGACLESVNWLADPSPKRISQSLGFMVNYKYDLAKLKENNEKYLLHHEIAKSPNIQNL
uniref:Malonyl-CoA decarboxylase C-terminal domain-containing protein n=1 Tax=Arcella intermedia TaxID=1963864 RepID=A0A6B2L5Q7_9EUKA